MRNYKKVTAMALCAAMSASLIACSGSQETTAPTSGGEGTEKPSKESDASKPANKDTREIHIGSWFDMYYTSQHSSPSDNKGETNIANAEMQLENMRNIEEKYNVKLIVDNLTWDGIIESINNSIIAGTPDCDVYLTDLQFGVPAVLNNYAQPLSSFVPEDNDIFKDQEVMTYLNVLNMEESYLFGPYAVNTSAYMLGFNLDAINAANLENPQDLYDRGEWTWDKFYEYCKVLTENGDTNGDGVVDMYRYSGWWTTFFSQMMLANGANVAGTDTQGLDSKPTQEVLEFISKLYKDGYAQPWNKDDWDTNVKSVASGAAAFWTTAHWVEQQYFIDPETGETPFTIGIVPFPIGPSANKDDIKTRCETDNKYFIPVGVKDPELVYNVMYDWINWHKGDPELRDDTEWAENMMTSGSDADLSARNFEYLSECGKNAYLDLWDKLGIDIGVFNLVTLDAETTPASLAEAHSGEIQAALDAYLGKK